MFSYPQFTFLVIFFLRQSILNAFLSCDFFGYPKLTKSSLQIQKLELKTNTKINMRDLWYTWDSETGADPTTRFQSLTFAKISISVPYFTFKCQQIFINYTSYEDLSSSTTDFTCVWRDTTNLWIILIWFEPLEAIIFVYMWSATVSCTELSSTLTYTADWLHSRMIWLIIYI